MKPVSRLFLFPLIILLFFTTVPAVHAQAVPAVEPIAADFTNPEMVDCGDPAVLYNDPSPEIYPADDVDVYSLKLVAGQVLTIDVDTADQGVSLDTILFVYFDSNPADDIYPVTPIAWNDISSKIPLNNDPYLEITAEAEGNYYLVIYDSTNDGNTGPYTFSLKCTDPSTPPDTADPLETNDLLGSTASISGSLVMIDPADGTGTVRFSSVTGPVADLEYQYSTHSLLVAINDDPGAIITIDPDTGNEGPVFKVDVGAVIALEDAAGVLYGVHVANDDVTGELYSLVAIDQSTGELDFLTSLGNRPFSALAYHSVEKVMYGVVSSVSNGVELVTIDLTSLEITTVGSTGLGQVVALDFNNENVLYGVEVSGTLFYIPELGAGLAEEIGPIDVSAEAMALAGATTSTGVSGLTFVVEEPPEDDPTIKTICSSSFTNQMAASSDSNDNKVRRSRFKRNPLHGAIGLFKFEGRADEIIKLEVYPEDAELVAAEESSTSSWFDKLWWRRKLKNRVFVVIRDAIPGVRFRVKKKHELPLLIEDLQLPEDGWYYIMVIRPLRRFHEADYCLSLVSNDPESTAWESLEVAWPNNDSEEKATSTSTEAKTAEVQKDDVADEGSSGTGDTTPAEPAEVVPAPTTVEPVSVAPAIAPTSVSPEETTVQETVKAAPAKEPTAEATEQPTVMGAPLIPEETTVDDAEELVAPAKEPTVEPTAQPTVMGAPLITEETTVDETEDVTPEESADETTGDDETTDDSGSDEGESADGETRDGDDEEPMLMKSTAPSPTL